VNRAERRAAARSARRGGRAVDDVNCGCQVRGFEAIEHPTCPECQKPHQIGWRFDMPSTAEPGETVEFEAGCSCGAEFRVLAVCLP
jgi:hypothetical protein